MPQMAPMNWTLLFAVFICAYLVSMILIYFSSNSTNSSTEQHYGAELSPSTNNLWKW